MIQITLKLSDERKALLDGLAASLYNPDTMTTPKNSEVLRAALMAFVALSEKKQRRYVKTEVDRAREVKRGPKT